MKYNKLLIILLFVVLLFSLNACTTKGQEVSKEEYESVYDSFLYSTNYKIVSELVVTDTAMKKEISHDNKTIIRVNLRGDIKVDNKESDTKRVDKYTVLNGIYGYYQDNKLYPIYDSKSGPIHILDKNNEEKEIEPINLTDEEIFNYLFLSNLPTNILYLPSFEDVTFDTKKGCYIDEDDYEYYFNNDHNLIKVTRTVESTTEFRKEVYNLTIKYGGQKLEQAPKDLVVNTE